MALQFGVSHAGGPCEYVRVRRWPFRIGRSPKNDLCLANSERISRRHAEVYKVEEDHFVVAVGRNPSFLNGATLPRHEPQAIQAGDVIELPDYRLEVRDTAAARSEPPAATVNVQATGSSIITRLVASRLGLQQWSFDGIFAWLQGEPGRAVRVRHEHLELHLAAAMSRDEVGERLTLFGGLLELLDLQQITVEVFDAEQNRAAAG